MEPPDPNQPPSSNASDGEMVGKEDDLIHEHIATPEVEIPSDHADRIVTEYMKRRANGDDVELKDYLNDYISLDPIYTADGVTLLD